ncbi:DUF441 domain-containing protein [Atopobacter sp. AH10]|uniref:DUF441 domain-containing protein n=1 Tax=Atopobacter sp. AH10 TaxID=2315861 RepID=UPI000EF1C9CA|nr:DUF441 domain-containing protein [Atopobacter sp. AH10]RLK63325.1 DUF441 domain-containing protein [Atopobacter sp. AH10]
MESYLFLFLILLIAYLSKNNSLIIATLVIVFLKLLPFSQRIFSILQAKGIHWGVTFITITILVPIATGEIGLKDLLECFKSPIGWIAITCGIAVAIFSYHGVNLIAQSPQVSVALVIGTIIGVVCFKGLAAGPIIAAGITYYLYSGLMFLMHLK